MWAGELAMAQGGRQDEGMALGAPWDRRTAHQPDMAPPQPPQSLPNTKHRPIKQAHLHAHDVVLVPWVRLGVEVLQDAHLHAGLLEVGRLRLDHLDRHHLATPAAPDVGHLKAPKDLAKGALAQEVLHDIPVR